MHNTTTLKLSPKTKLHAVSDMLFGLFIEDINFSCDGGLSANMVKNHSFDGIYLSRKGYSLLRSVVLKKDPKAEIDRLRYWNFSGLSVTSLCDDPVSANSWYARISVGGCGILENRGYGPVNQNAETYAMAIKQGEEYRFSCWLRGNFSGEITVQCFDANGIALTEEGRLFSGPRWFEYGISIRGLRTAYGKLVIKFAGDGIVDVDGIRFYNENTWGKGDPRWSQGKLRADLVEVLKDLKPKFLRFPGGCIVEGNEPGNEYNWKETVGPLIERKGKYSLWGAVVKDGGYFQSFEIGFYEYFLLCEDLQMEPLPTLYAGLSCQARSKRFVETNSKHFHDYVVRSYIDLVEYANGDPEKNKWARMRAEAGHPRPFNLRYIGIGNENFGEDYLEKFDTIKNAISSRYPDIQCVMTSGIWPRGKEFEKSWDRARSKHPDVIVDEHCYSHPRWFIKAFNRYDNYPRGGAQVYLGEYAANFPMGVPLLSLKPNCFETALGEAVFLAGLERNSDVVKMSSYAPLLALAGAEQWPHNLIVFNPSNILLTANYYVQRMFGANLGDHVIESSGELPRGVYHSATATRESTIVKLVNTATSGIEIEIVLDERAGPRCEIESMHSYDQRAVNSMSFDGKPEYRIQPQHHSVRITDARVKIRLSPKSINIVTIPRA